MICGDKIVTTNVRVNGALAHVEVFVIEKHELVWRILYLPLDTTHWHIIDANLNFEGWITGRVSKRDRGRTWCPAWLDDEVDLLTVVAALLPRAELPNR